MQSSSRETSTSMVVNVQNKLRLALGSLKDHASIGKAMIYNRDGLSSIDIAVLKATSHDNIPIDDKHMHEILFLVSNSPAAAAAAGCSSIPYLSQTISHRFHKTRDRFVALKTLMLVHRLLRGGDRKFEEGLRNAYLTGHLRMNTQYWLSITNSSSISSDNSIYFLRNYAEFLEERMGWIINQAGKLEPILFQGLEFRFHEEKSIEMVFHRLPKFQLFLGKVLNCASVVLEMSSPSSDDCLLIVRAAMRNILRESFQVYLNFCQGVATLSDSFFDFKDPARVLALQLLEKASQQSYQLFDFFETLPNLWLFRKSK